MDIFGEGAHYSAYNILINSATVQYAVSNIVVDYLVLLGATAVAFEPIPMSNQKSFQKESSVVRISLAATHTTQCQELSGTREMRVIW